MNLTEMNEDIASGDAGQGRCSVRVAKARGDGVRNQGGSAQIRDSGICTRGGSVSQVETRRGLESVESETNESFFIEFIEEDSTRVLEHDNPLEMPVPSKRRCVLGSIGPHVLTDPILPGPSTSSVDPPSPSNHSIFTDWYQLEELFSTPCSRQPLRDEDSDSNLSYGSEDSDSEGEGDLEGGNNPVYITRAHRELFSGDDEESSQAKEPEPSPPASPVLAPYSFFSFDWRDFPNPPVPPTERREVFSNINCGPTASYNTPYDAFIAIWDSEFMEYIVVETNRYAQQIADRISRWQPTDVDEMYVFFGFLMATSLCVKSAMKEYWNKKGLLATPNFGHYMTINRFLLLSRCLHFNNNSTDLRTMTRCQAKIFKIAPVIQHLNDKFQSLYNLSRNLALDESLTMWKGMLDINQFIKTKAASAGIKTYEVCEAQTGYLWRFNVHAGREEVTSETPVSGVTENLVLDLLKGLENKGHTVWMDNYYNSPALARVLKTLGFDCVGTLKTNRKYVPKKLAELKISDMEVGQLSGCTSGDVDILVWRHRNRVAFISTYHGLGVHTDNDGVTKPIVVRDYNLSMGGVDKKDQMLSAYSIERQGTHVWYKRFFRRLLNASILNAFILYSQSSLPKTVKRFKHREFRQNLLKDILSHHSNKTLPEPIIKPNLNLTPKVLFDHFPMDYGLIPGSNRKERLRRSCVVCHKRTQTRCSVCEVALCLNPCYKLYHEIQFQV